MVLYLGLIGNALIGDVSCPSFVGNRGFRSFFDVGLSSLEVRADNCTVTGKTSIDQVEIMMSLRA